MPPVAFLKEAGEVELMISILRVVKFRSLAENRKLFDVSPAEGQKKFLDFFRII